MKVKNPLVDMPHNKNAKYNGQSLESLCQTAMDSNFHYAFYALQALMTIGNDGYPYLLVIIRDGPYESAEQSFIHFRNENPKIMQEYFEFIKPGLERLIQQKSPYLSSLEEIRTMKPVNQKKNQNKK